MKPFPQTRWSLILDAREHDSRALEDLCASYWFPLYGYARRMGLKPEDAEDLTQAFYEKLLAREFFQSVKQGPGRLRSLLLTSMKNFATDEWRREHAEKRGGKRIVEMDALSAEQQMAVEAKDNVTPELEFDRRWGREILQQAKEKLRAAYETADKTEVFQAFESHLQAGEAKRSYAEIACSLGLTESTARLTAFKLRQRYRKFIEETIVDTVATADDAAEELAHLQSLFETPAA